MRTIKRPDLLGMTSDDVRKLGMPVEESGLGVEAEILRLRVEIERLESENAALIESQIRKYSDERGFQVREWALSPRQTWRTKELAIAHVRWLARLDSEN